MLETLESRMLATVVLEKGELFILGSAGADTIAFDTGKKAFSLIMTRDGTPQQIKSFSFKNVKHITVYAGAGNDSVIMGRLSIPALIKGEDGNDTISGGAGKDVVSGSAGDDYVCGCDGNDTVDGGLGADNLLGGPGKDVLDYSRRTKALSISLGVLPDDGELLEGDNARTDFEIVLGGTGSDVIYTTSGRAVEIYGDLGDNTLTGGSGVDLLHGGLGRDVLIGNGGNDIFFSQDGEFDVLLGGSGNNSMGDVGDLLDSLTQLN